MLVRVFVDASPHIPEHRQLPLFTHLISTVGSMQFLHTVVILLLEKHVAQGSASPDEKQVSFDIVQFQKISVPTPWKVNGNSEGVGVSKAKIFKGKYMGLNWNFQREGGIQTKEPSMGGVWIFPGITSGM